MVKMVIVSKTKDPNEIPPLLEKEGGGITLPERDELATLAGGEKKEDIDVTSLISTSRPAVDEAQVRRETEAELAGARAGISAGASRRIEIAQKEKLEQERALEGQLGTRRRFSSSAKAFIQFINDKHNERIADLEIRKEEALAGFDIELARLADNRIQSARNAQQQDFQNAVLLFQLSQQDLPGKEERESLIRSEKDAAIIDAMQGGLTTVAGIFERIRGSREDITIDDITSSLKSMGDIAGVTGGNSAEKLTGDAKNFLLLKENFPDTLPSFVTSLPENQQLGAYMQWIEAGGKGNGFAGGSLLGGSSTTGLVAGMTKYTRDILVARLGKQIYGTRISDKESERVQSFITLGMADGKSDIEIMDDVLGFKITRNRPLAENLRNVLLSIAGEDGLAGFDMLGLARLINDGKDGQAIQRVEQSAYTKAKDLNPDFFISESVARFADSKVTEITTEINNILGESEGVFDLLEDVLAGERDLADAPIGVVEGTMEKWLGRFKSKEGTIIAASVTNLVSEMRKRLLGSAVTPSEERFLRPLLPELSDSPANFMAKLDELRTDPLLRLNTMRATMNLPALTAETLQDFSKRSAFYTQMPTMAPEDFFNSPVPDTKAETEYNPNVWNQPPEFELSPGGSLSI